MTKTAKDFIAEARKTVRATAPAEARADAEANRAIILDVREAEELSSGGKPVGSVHVLCASGGRAVLAARTLNAMGYDATVIEGGMKGWTEAGLDVV